MQITRGAKRNADAGRSLLRLLLANLQKRDDKMDPNLHQKQAVNHLNKVLDYAPVVAEDGDATVHLTQEDWQVVADCLFKMDTPDEMLPDAINGYSLTNQNRTIALDTDDYQIDVEVI